MILVDVIRAGACLLPLLARTPHLLPFAYLGVVIISIGSAYFEPASQAALPNIVKPEELGPANVLMGSTWGTMLAAGAANRRPGHGDVWPRRLVRRRRGELPSLRDRPLAHAHTVLGAAR